MVSILETDHGDSALLELLMEFHEWMAGHAEAYDPVTELTDDVESLAQEAESWAWLARREGESAGCVLLYGETETLAEFRRLWVTPKHRGAGIGKELTEAVIERARTEGYETLGLTTPPWAEASHALYESLGFERTPPYPETRLPEKFHNEAIFMQLSLAGGAKNPNQV